MFDVDSLSYELLTSDTDYPEIMVIDRKMKMLY